MGTEATRKPLRVLIVEDDEDAANIVVRELKRGGFDPVFERVDTPAAMRAALETKIWDVVTCDYEMPLFSGPAALELMQERGLDLPFIVVSGKIGEVTAGNMLKAGATDYLMKDKLQRLASAVERALTEAEVRRGRNRAQEALARSEERLRLAIEASRLVLWDYDVPSGRVYLSETWSEMMGGPAAPTETTIGALTALVPAEERAAVREAMIPAIKTEGTSYRVEHRISTPSGELRWIVSAGKVIERGADGRALRAIGTNLDITESKRAVERLRIGQTAARLIVADWHVLEDQLEWSDSPEWLRGPLPESGKYPPLKDQVHPEDRELFLGMRAKTLDTGEEQSFEYRIVRTDGETLWIRSQHRVSAYSQGKVARILVALLDITEYRRALDQIHFLAYQDSLTGLPNRVLSRDRMQQAIAHADRSKTQVALLFIDLDNFKSINDSLGHPAGDALLKLVAATLRDCVRETDTVSRQGGDEFVVLITDLREADAVTPVMEKLIKRFNASFQVGGEELQVSASVGVALYPDDGGDFDTLLKKADTAMYRAKAAGKNTYRFYDEHMNVDAVENMRLRSSLRGALEQGEFVLHYQPQIDLRSGAVIGAEALIRWNHPQLGMVPPGRFIPLAEESGLIVPIGEWVLREACRQASAWRSAGLPELVVAVNLSGVQFRQGGLEQAVAAALKHSGLHPTMLELELTESILIHDTETILAAVQRLKSLGLRLSIDDFGTGYSSLSYLKRFAVDKLKIDQSFIRNLADDPENSAIVHAIIQMARSLNLRTIAEGVENNTLLHHLRDYNCDEAQGYHFARPMPAAEFAVYLARQPTVPS